MGKLLFMLAEELCLQCLDKLSLCILSRQSSTGSLEESSAFAHAALSHFAPACATEQIYFHVEICCLIFCFPSPTHKSPPAEPMNLEHSQELHGSYGIWTTWDCITRRVIMPLMSARKTNDFSAVVSEEEVTTHLVTTTVLVLASTRQSWFGANVPGTITPLPGTHLALQGLHFCILRRALGPRCLCLIGMT